MKTTIPIVFLAGVAFLSAGAARAAEVVFEEGIEYANPDDQHLKLNMARPKEVKEGELLPAVVCIHGGGFRAGERTSYDGLCRRLADQGYVAVTVTYRLSPKYPFPAAVYDVKEAVRWLRASGPQYHVDANRIAALGSSAGGHLALFLGVTGDVKMFDPPPDEKPKTAGDSNVSTRVQCVVSYYGPSDFTRSYGKSVDAAEVLPLFLGGDLEHERRRHILASPLYWVTPAAPPTLLLQGTEDKYVNHEQAVWMHDRLKAADVEVDLQSLEGAGHGFKGEDSRKADAAAIDFLDKHLKPGTRPSTGTAPASPER